MSDLFNADQEAAALEPWSVQIGNRVYRAQLVSRPAVLAFLAVVNRPGVPPEAEEVALAKLLRIAFPRRVLRDWWSGDPVAKIMALDYRVRQAALVSFFASLAPLGSPNPPGTNGMTDSTPSSADASA